MNLGSSLVAPLTTHTQRVAFATLVLFRMRALVEEIRRQPAPACNIVDEALGLGFSMAAGAPFDIQRVYELVGIDTGTSGVMVWKDGEAQIVGRSIDLVLRAIARPDQAATCAARAADMLLALHEFDFGDARAAVEQERQYLARLAQVVGAQQSRIEVGVLAHVPDYARGGLAAHAAAKVGKPWHESFGAAAATFPGPEWRDPYEGADLKDGRDPKTTRTGHVEGW
jgi:hypothetical protein